MSKIQLPWVRRFVFIGFVAVMMVVAIPRQVISQVNRTRNISRTFLGPLSLSGGQILEVVTSWNDNGCKHCTKVEFKLWDTQATLIASTSVSADSLFGKLEISRQDLARHFRETPANKPVDVFVTVQTPQQLKSTSSLSAYDGLTGRTDSMTCREPWVVVKSRKNRKTMQSCPVGLNHSTAAQVTLVNTQKKPIRARLLFFDPEDRDVLLARLPEGDKFQVVPAGRSVRLRLDGLDLVTMEQPRRTVVAVVQTQARGKKPLLVSLQLVNTETGRTIYLGNNSNLLSD